MVSTSAEPNIPEPTEPLEGSAEQLSLRFVGIWCLLLGTLLCVVFT